MIKISLSTEEVAKLNILKVKHQGNRKVLRRLRFLEYRNDWISWVEIKKILEVSIDTMTDRAKKFVEWWFDSLCHLQFTGKRSSVYAQHENIIKAEIDAKIHNSYKELRYAVEQKIWVWRQYKTLYNFCKKKWIPVTKSVM